MRKWGKRMRISNFKKLLLSTSIIGTMVLLVGCGSKSSNQNFKKTF